MMNLISLGLVLTSSLLAQVLSPSPETPPSQKEDVIFKEGHRVVVVETYDEGGQQNTKVSISPEQKQGDYAHGSGLEDLVKQRVKEASHVLPNLGQGVSEGGASNGKRHVPGELICDAFGKCTHKTAAAMGKVKDKVSGVAHEAVAKEKEMAHEAAQETKEFTKKVAHEAQEKVEDGYEKGKEAALRKAHEAQEKVEEGYEKAKEVASRKAREAQEKVEDGYGKAREVASQKAHEAKEMAEDVYDKGKESTAEQAHHIKESAKESLGKAKERTNTAKDAGKTIAKDAAGNLTEQIMKKPKEGTEKAKRSFVQAWNAFSSKYVGSLMNVVNLLGFTLAYGMCVWVTFVSSYVLAGALPKQQFAIVQGKMYPVYFRAMAYSTGLALVGHIFGHGMKMITSKAVIFQFYNLMTSIFLVLLNAVYLVPLATRAMHERMKLEKEEGRGLGRLDPPSALEQWRQDHPVAHHPAAGPTTTTQAEATAAPEQQQENRERDELRTKLIRKSETLKKLNSYSSLLNIFTLMALTWHLVYLGQRLHTAC